MTDRKNGRPTPAEAAYRAFCKKCGATVETGDASTFMAPFFLPERCPGCHRYHDRHAWSSLSDHSLYRVEYGYWRFVPAQEQPPKVWFLPWTWRPVGERVWTQWDEHRDELVAP